jgi:hypothetical protein
MITGSQLISRISFIIILHNFYMKIIKMKLKKLKQLAVINYNITDNGKWMIMMAF